MNLKDKAKDRPEVQLARQSAPGAYRMLTTELVSAEDLTPEGEFPEYGDFLQVGRVGTDATQYIECPAALARYLVNDLEAAEGDQFRIESVTKIDGEWQYTCHEIETDKDGDLTLAEAAGSDD